MPKKCFNFPQFLSSVVFAVAFTFLFFTHSEAQNNLTNENLSINSYKAISDAETPAPERPRFVSKNNQNSSKDNINESSEKFVDKKSKSDSKDDTAALLLRMEQQAFEILNLRRLENGLPPLKWSDDMAKLARLHSQDMAEYHYFSHSGRNGSMVNDRADLLGFSNWQSLGENIAFNRGFEKPVESACESWMKSPTHRDNILNSRWKEAGIGVAVAVDGSYYFTEVFILR